MQIEKQLWQKIISTLKGFATPRTTEQKQLVGELQDQLVSLKSELSQLQSRYSELETGQVGHDRQLEGLEAADEKRRSGEQALLEGIKNLEQRCGGIEAEGDSTRNQLRILENTLTETASRHDSTDQQVRGLEEKLEGERKRYETNRHRVEERLAWVRNEHESMHQVQSEMADSIRRRRRLAPVAAGVVLLLGVLAGAAIFRDVQKDVHEQAPMISDSAEPTKPPTIQQDKPLAEERASLMEDSVDSAALETEPVPADRTESATLEESVSMADPDVVEPQVSEPVIEEQVQQIGDPPDLPKEGEPVAIPAQRPLTSSQAVVAAQTFDANAFFKENASKEGVVSLPSGLQYKVLRAGQGKSPGSRDMVILHYRGSLPDGRVFDDSYAEEAPAAYRVDEVIPGWREALQRMQEGAKWELYIPPKLAHSSGTQGAPGFLPRIYQIELIAVSPTGGSYAP